MFSPACLSFEPLWSALPSASRLSSSVALPTPSFTLPPSSSDLLSTLSSKAIATSKGYGASTGEIPVVTLGNPDWRRDLARRQRSGGRLPFRAAPHQRAGRVQHRAELAGRHRAGEVVAPRRRITERAQQFRLVGGLPTLGDGVQAEGLGEVDARRRHGHAAVDAGLGERAVQL